MSKLRTKITKPIDYHLVIKLKSLQPFKNKPENPFSFFFIFAKTCQDNIIIMTNQFGDRIRELRTKQQMLLRHVASRLDVDISIISKIEKGDRQMKKEQINTLADILHADKEELMTLWLEDQLYSVIEGEPMAVKALESVSQKLKMKK
jgi:DNA-binding XRE family transcriptional regulator